jgi:hypothetical protein
MSAMWIASDGIIGLPRAAKFISFVACIVEFPATGTVGTVAAIQV